MRCQCLRNIKQFSFSHRTVDIWNRLSDEIVTAESVHKFNMLDKCRHRDTTR
ncbi:hypothetical protein E2C01_056791 [Portunus trituberculatus]|uniref:Uncharacterized protein n=1 Tax=Portunus trituberculatus TaxID=210409 RepID=A0A5B7GV43_PORTR|nr:hypothetical protein [Portunus trituberculatus]